MLLPAFDMALPVVSNFKDCADWSRTVSPYIPQLYALFQELPKAATNLDQLKALYLSTNPVVFGFASALFLAPIFLVTSEINKNYSQVDRFWSILPAVWVAHFWNWARMSGIQSQRLDAATAVACVWSARLTFNYWRKGGYSIGSEDYRWEIIQSKVHPALFTLFNITFIATYQPILLFLVTCPAYLLVNTSRLDGGQMNTTDIFFSSAIALIIATEFVADQQQWNYQNAKKEYQKTAKVPEGFEREDLDRGFLTSGLWSWSRHPNFACEISVWVTLYEWACFQTDTFISWAAVGPLLYVLLFEGSTWFTEMISAGKYQDYKQYQKKVGKFMPGMPF